jgi:hypothetical protein
MNRSDVLFVGTILIHLSLLLTAASCLRRRLLTRPVLCLLIYAVISIYTDSVVAGIKLDRLLGWGGAVRQRVASVADITFTLDAIARLAVLTGICLCIMTLTGLKERSRSIDSEIKRVG